MPDKISAWIGLVASVVTISLTVLNYNLNKQIQKTEIEFKKNRK